MICCRIPFQFLQKSQPISFCVQDRSNILLRFADLLEKHNDEIAALESWDTGKPFKQSALVEVPMLTRFFRYYAGMSSQSLQ